MYYHAELRNLILTFRKKSFQITKQNKQTQTLDAFCGLLAGTNLNLTANEYFLIWYMIFV